MLLPLHHGSLCSNSPSVSLLLFVLLLLSSSFPAFLKCCRRCRPAATAAVAAPATTPTPAPTPAPAPAPAPAPTATLTATVTATTASTACLNPVKGHLDARRAQRNSGLRKRRSFLERNFLRKWELPREPHPPKFEPNLPLN